MKVKKITAPVQDAQAVPELLDKENVAFQAIDTVNWKEYPYQPQVAFRIAHTDHAILIHYKVTEGSVRAKYGEDNGSVWTDSCVEFFSVPAADGIYYNMECNCIGTFLIGAGPQRNNREHAPQEVMDKVLRWASLGRQPFAERVGECTWEVALVVPYTAFFKHHITSLDGQTVKANFYKCGDELQTPHFLSWNPIKIENPDFHRPDFFGSLEFE
ncbi:carbohydrate-binding family 9-like protein [Phocaeicola sp.]